jgi:hypothetical protein
MLDNRLVELGTQGNTYLLCLLLEEEGRVILYYFHESSM